MVVNNSPILSTAKSSVPRGFRKKEMKEAGARNVNIYISHIFTLDVDSYLIYIGKT